MAASEFHFDTRIRRHHVSLMTQQHRLRHLRSVVARNVLNGDNNTLHLHYSLHHKPDSVAFYTSEIITEDPNPTWKELKPSTFPQTTNSASCFVTVKLWNSSRLIVEWVVFFSGLHFLGKQIPKEGKNFKQNTLIFGMLEGFYGCTNCYQHSSGEMELGPKESILVDIASLVTSCELSTLERIKTIERAIKQTQATALRRKQDIEKKLHAAEKFHFIHAQLEFYRIKLSMLYSEVKHHMTELSALQKKSLSSQEILEDNKLELKRKREELDKSKEKVVESWQNFCSYRELLLKTDAQLIFRRKQLISDLCLIYPIVEFPDSKGFSIHNVYLPNSENLSGHDSTMMAIALGYVCHVVLLICQFLNVPLRYPMQFGGSRSSITDHISSTIPVKIKDFPLFLKGKDRRLFEYAVYLLNKNIAQIRILCGLTTKDLTATLPNLSSLIELRLSALNESYSLPMLRPFLSEESSKFPTENVAPQNGLLHNQDPENPIEQDDTDNKKDINKELEYLKKEMAEMMPDHQPNSELPARRNDISKELSCSLDKGLNDIKVLENSFVPSSQTTPKLEKANLKLRKVGQGIHHSSYPNLNSTLQPLANNGVLFPAESIEFQSAPLKMWKTGGSQGNSEEEAFDENALANASSGLVMTDSCFYIQTSGYVMRENTSGAATTDSDFVMIDKVMLNDKEDDLVLRTERLASRSSSFQMQKMSSNVDSRHMHI